MKALALWHISPEASEIIEQNLPEAGESQLVIKSLYSMVSMGTERIVAGGLIPPSIQQQMQVPYMEGSFSFPCKYGYSLVGKVLKGPDYYSGKLVHLMHPHQNLVCAETSSISIIPDEIPARRAVLASNMETAINAIWDSEISVGDSILIAGFGLIGTLIAMLARDIPGVTITILEPDENRCKIAQKMGFQLLNEFSVPENSFDAAFNTSSNADALQRCIDTTGYESQITELSLYGAKQASLSLGNNFHIGRKKIVASQVSHLPGKKISRWNFERRKKLVFELLKKSSFDSLVAYSIPFTESPALFSSLRKGNSDVFSVVLSYD